MITDGSESARARMSNGTLTPPPPNMITLEIPNVHIAIDAIGRKNKAFARNLFVPLGILVYLSILLSIMSPPVDLCLGW